MTSFETDIIKQITDHFADHFADDYIVIISYKYSFEKKYHTSIEVFCIDFDKIVWFNDWYEGQEDVLVGIVVPVSQAYIDHFTVCDIQKVFKERGEKE